MSESKVKVLLILPELDRGGPTLGAAALGCYLDSEKYEVTVGSLGTNVSAAKSMIDLLEHAGVQIHYFSIPGWIGLLQLRRIRSYVVYNHIEIVHSFGIRPDIVNYFLRAIACTVGSVRGMLRQEYRLRYGWFIEKFFTTLHLAVLQRLDSVTALSQAMSNYLAEEGISAQKITYIPNMIDSAWYCQEANTVSSGKIKFESGVVHVGVVGSLIARKRVDLIIRAVVVLRQRGYNNVHVHIIGDGPLLLDMKRLAWELHVAHVVTFHGFVEKSAPLMKNFDLIVLCSQSEGIPRVILEAMVLGKICIAADIPGINEVIDDGITGYLFNGTSADLAEKLLQAIKEIKKFDAEEIKSRIEVRYGAVHGAARMGELYTRLVQS
ncbi:MAG: glycosyltransferase [bacterium]|nr:glycosyltransferase [bacterium]